MTTPKVPPASEKACSSVPLYGSALTSRLPGSGPPPMILVEKVLKLVRLPVEVKSLYPKLAGWLPPALVPQMMHGLDNDCGTVRPAGSAVMVRLLSTAALAGDARAVPASRTAARRSRFILGGVSEERV